MSYNPMIPLYVFPQYFLNPNFQNAQLQGHPFPYNVLYMPRIDEGAKISMHPKFGFLPNDVYNRQPTVPSKEELEKEYKEILGNQLQKGDKEQEMKNSQPEEEKEKPKQNALISFDTLTAGTIQSSSGIFNGKNVQFGWSSHSKTNNGFGTVDGNNNTFHNNINVVFNNDQLDTPIDDRFNSVPTP